MSGHWGDSLEDIARAELADQARFRPLSGQTLVLCGKLAGILLLVGAGWVLADRALETAPPDTPALAEFAPRPSLRLAWTQRPVHDSAVLQVAQAVSPFADVTLVATKQSVAQVKTVWGRVELAAQERHTGEGHLEEGHLEEVDLAEQHTIPVFSDGPAASDHPDCESVSFVRSDTVRFETYFSGSSFFGPPQPPRLDEVRRHLLVNGAGLGLMSTHLVSQGYTRAQLEQQVREEYGVTKLVFLEPLAGEPSGNIETFAMFVGYDVVLVAQHDVDQDPTNRDILDRNAELLQGLATPFGALRVQRIPVPPQPPGQWRSYTSGILVNRTLVMPVFQQARGTNRVARQIFRQLLPGWRIRSVDATDLALAGETLRGISMVPPTAEP